MSNLIVQARLQAAELTQRAYEKAAAAGLLPAGAEVKGGVDIPKVASMGDFASSFAMAGARVLRKKPMDIAGIIAGCMDLEGSYFQKVEAAKPGFLNFTLGPRWYGQVLADIEAEGPEYGASDEGKGRKVMVEFVSANPTGPMHLGNARGGVLGDTLASILSRAGWDVWREFYVNDAGNQIHKFAVSIFARCMELTPGHEDFPFPEDGYQGDDIRELASSFLARCTEEFPGTKPEEQWMEEMSAYGLSVNIPRMKSDLEKYGITYDEWFLESSLHESGYVAETVQLLADRGWTYEKDGSLWLKTSELLRRRAMAEGKTREQAEKMDFKDDVLCRSNGFYTYFAADIAYHRDKLERRGFDIAVDVWGADHHGHVARLQAALDGLDLDGSHRLVVVLMQLVKLLRDGEPVTMSKRHGTAIALNTLLDEISVDAARYYFNSHAAATPIDFDLSLAVRQDGENPVYYVQYAHARICSLVARLEEDGHPVPAAADINAALLNTPEELALIKSLAQFPQELILAAREYDSSRINRFLVSLAGDFHRFYNACRIRGEAPDVLAARLKLADSVRSVLANGLGLLGVTAPVRM